MPHAPIEDVADAYTKYVLICGIPEETFWNANIYFLSQVVENHTAYSAWLENEKARQIQLSKRK